MEKIGYIQWLADSLDVAEPALRLLISLLFGYPIAFFHRKYLYGNSLPKQHLYFIICGISLCYFNYGWDTIHSFAAISITYLILKIFGGSVFSVLVIFVYSMVHLLAGYWTTATASYDIKWTMPHCVLTLRLIGLAFNVYDGQQDSGSLSRENKEVALKKLPSALEVFAHCYFPTSFLIGPQFPLQRYHDFVELKLEKKANPKELPKSLNAGIFRLCLGLMYLLIHQVGSMYVYNDYFTSEAYTIVPMWKKFLLLGLWSRITLYKYISCWMITEGACIIMGLTYNGEDEKGEPKWDGCSNVKLSVFETSTRMNHYIESFNINTNHWVAQYIYKRLKFLNNKSLSHMGTLLFLAIWHGFHSGYYATFFFEFILITAEKDVVILLEKNEMLRKTLNKPILYWISYVILRIYTFVIMGYAMIPFILLKHTKYIPVFKQFYFSVHIICLLLIFINPFLLKKFATSKKSSDTSSGLHKIQVKHKAN